MRINNGSYDDIEWVRNELKKAIGFLKEGKLKFAPTTTNSDVDMFLEKHKWFQAVKDLEDQYGSQKIED